MLIKGSRRDVVVREGVGALPSFQSPAAALPMAQLQVGLQRLMELSQPAWNHSLIRVVQLDGALRIPLLKAALQEIFKRHEILRRQIMITDQGGTQVLRSNWLPELPTFDLMSLPPQVQKEEWQRMCAEESGRSVDLAHDLLVRAKLLQLDVNRHLLVVCGHQILCDRLSVDLVIRALVIHYEALCQERGASTAPLNAFCDIHPVGPATAAPRSEAELEQDLRYWKARLEGAPTILELPSDHSRSLVKPSKVASVSLSLPAGLLRGLLQVGHQNRTDLTTVLIGAFQVLLSRHTGAQDILLGTQTSGREAGLENAIGVFANLVAVRGDLSRDPSFADFLGQIRDTLTESLKHQGLPFGQVVEAVLPDPPRGHAPLLQFVLTVQDAPDPLSTSHDVEMTWVDWPLENSGFDLSTRAELGQENLKLSMDYRTDLFDRETVVRLLDRFQILLESIVSSPERSLSRLSMLSEVERRQVLTEWNQTDASYPSRSTYPTCFEQSVCEHPGSIAVRVGGIGYSYQELNARANRLAHHLQGLGVKAETLVGLCLDRSLELAVALLAVLKAGGGFMPLDPAYPRQRLQLMIEDARPLLILTQSRHAPLIPFGSAKVLCLDAADLQQKLETDAAAVNPVNDATAESLGYVIYTSGSTGKPNGVEVTHRAMLNHSHAVARVYELSPADRVLQFASLSFDIAIEEIFPSWLRGCTVVFREEESVSSTQRFFEFLEKERVTLVNLPTAFWHQLIDDLPEQPLPTSVTRVIIGGEQASLAKWKAWLSHLDRPVKFYNAYGPTEATVTATIWEADTRVESSALSIGRPIANTRVYILDDQQQPAGVGVPGELFIAGDCLARGYRGEKRLTEARFVPDPFTDLPGARMYRTGDLVRWTNQGNIEFLGRLDSQLKIRGFRIEPAEVESVLNQHPAICSCVVVAEDRAGGGRELIAYLQARSAGDLSVAGLRDWLADKLADYMIPSRFVVIGELPMTPSGKVDRRSLSRSQGEELAPGTIHAPPTNEIERQLVEMWERLLGKRHIGIDDGFFDLGGNSLLAAQVFAQLESQYGKRLPLSLLFEAPSIRAIARKLLDREWAPSWNSLVRLAPHGKGQPIIFVHGILGNVLGFQSLARELGMDRPVYALQAPGLDGRQQTCETIEEMASLYIRQVVAAVPQGPYHLVGLSFGGLVAYEMAQQLKARGHHVGVLGILDAFPQGHDQSLAPQERNRYRWLSLVARLRGHWHDVVNDGIRGLPANIRARWLSAWDRIRRSLLRAAPGSSYSSGLVKPGGLDPVAGAVELAHNLALDRYTTRPYPGKVTLFLAADNPPSLQQLCRAAWRPLPVEGVEVHESPGNHNTMLEPPNDRALAMKLRSCLEAFEGL